MAKTSTKKKAAPKKNSLAGVSKVRSARQSDIEKEAARDSKRISEATLEQDYADFTSLISSRGWQRLKFINDENARLLAEQILNKRDLNGEPLDDKACDDLRRERDAILEVMTFPEKVIERYTLAHAPEPEDDADPYETAEQAEENNMEDSP